MKDLDNLKILALIIVLFCAIYSGPMHSAEQDSPQGIFQNLSAGDRVDLKDNGNSITLIAYPKKIAQISIFTVKERTENHIILIDAVGKTIWIPETSIKTIEFWFEW
jgi:hypothetical protein